MKTFGDCNETVGLNKSGLNSHPGKTVRRFSIPENDGYQTNIVGVQVSPAHCDRSISIDRR